MQDSEAKKLFQWVQRHAGLSRRKAQELISTGEVTVNGSVVTDPFAPLAPSALRSLALRGHPLPMEPPEPRIYRHHKPDGVLCSHDDPHDGNTVGRLLRMEGFIGYTWAGRLDRDAEGLLVLTNAGEVVNAFTHPRYEVEKVYHVWTSPSPKPAAAPRIFAEMRNGIADDGETLRILDGHLQGRPVHAVVRLAEGRKHEVKRLFAHFHLDVRRLLRVTVGPIELGDLKRGEATRLSRVEEGQIFDFVQSRLAAH